MTRAWIRIPNTEDAKAILTTALERGFDTFVLEESAAKTFASLGKFRALVMDGARVREGTEDIATRVRIASIADQDKALDLAGKVKRVLVDARDWKIIPLENLIAAYQKSKTQLIAEVDGVEEARVFLETLEKGVDTVLFSPTKPADVLALAKALAGHASPAIELTRATVTRVQTVGSGDRVCIDTASMLRVGEGMLIGSQSGGLVLVHSESLESGYVAARPFRVNAGPVHAYCLLPSGKTKYLSELRAGDEVLAVDAEGHTRPVIVGRLKIETRPLLLVEAEVGDHAIATLLQNAETIRVVTPDGPVSVVDLKQGDTILVRVDTQGRHFGTAIDETITER